MPDRSDQHQGTDATRATPRGKRGSAARRVGPYRIDGELGRGGMGVVYRAFDERLHRDVALKALPEDLVGDREQLARLEREARSLALVSHPNVAAIHGMEQADDATYLVLELVAGETLRERLDRGALDVDEALALCAHAAAGLAAVHRKGLVHRDLKPSNVMVTPDGVAKLLDFGLARQSRAAARGEVTRRGDVMGTSGWMSPEQLRGEELDARSDAWAWGCLLYECLAGARAFPGDTDVERDAATLKDEPAWERLPELSASVLDLLKSCLSKDRAGRPQEIDDARHVLEEARLRSTDRRAVAAFPKHFLPAERDAFVGREAELAELGRLLDEGHRLVSVLGLGGTGKTRLVLRLARESLPRLPGGAWFCDLSEARSVEGIVAAVATALGVALARDPVVQLGHAVAARGKCLVILDNFEQVARHAEATLGQWLDRCPEAAFVVTTREVLGLAGEEHVALQPLPQVEGEELFVVRARTAHHGFAPDDGERHEIAKLVKELDCLPLAVELAAARTRVMPVKQLLARMTERFKLLAGTGTRRDRQATLRATFDWSWELLSDDERKALAQLSVFEGGFTLEAAEAVMSLAELWPADAVHALVDKSWIRPASHARFDLLVSVQEYAAERLVALGGRTEAERRHGACFAQLGTSDALEALRRHGGVERRRTLARDIDNVVATCRRAVAREDGATAVAALRAAWAVIELSGPFAIAVDLAADTLELPLSPALRARATVVRGAALVMLGDGDAALPCLESVIAGPAASDRSCVQKAHRLLGSVHLQQGRWVEARARYDVALAMARAAGERGEETNVLGMLASVDRSEGRFVEARACFDAALAIAREDGDRRAEGNLIADMGFLLQVHGRPDEARACFEQSLPIHREVGNRRAEGVVLTNLGSIDTYQGRAAEAEASLTAALVLNRATGNRLSEAHALANMGFLLVQQGRIDEGRACIEPALAMARELGDLVNQGTMLLALGHAHAEQGRPDAALTCYESCLEIRRRLGDRLGEAYAQTYLASLLMSRGDMDEARASYDFALATFRELGDTHGEGRALRDLGALNVRTGLLDEARRCLDEGERLLRDAHDVPELAELACTRACLESRAGRPDAARVALAQAEALVASAGGGAESPARRALATARAEVEGGAS